MDDNHSLKEKPWFKRKILGWIWTPTSWQGWTVTFVYILIFYLASRFFDRGLVFWLVVIAATVFLIAVAKKKGRSAGDDFKNKGGREEKYRKYY